MYKCIDGVPYFSSDYVLSREAEVDRLKKVEKEHQRINGELRVENTELKNEVERKAKVINDLLKRVASLEYEVEKLGEKNEATD